MTTPVREGVYFTTPPTLPKGRHGLDHGTVLRSQRERLMIAATELLAADGYRALAVRDVATRAHVSQPAFYECFLDKEDCLFAAYDRFTTVLTGRLLGAVTDPGPTWAGVVTDVVMAYARALQDDPVVARAFLLELDALGRPARDRRRSAIHGIALLLRDQRERYWPGARPVPLAAYAAAVYAMRQLTADQLDVPGQEHRVAAVAAGLVPTVSAMLAPPA